MDVDDLKKRAAETFAKSQADMVNNLFRRLAYHRIAAGTTSGQRDLFAASLEVADTALEADKEYGIAHDFILNGEEPGVPAWFFPVTACMLAAINLLQAAGLSKEHAQEIINGFEVGHAAVWEHPEWNPFAKAGQEYALKVAAEAQRDVEAVFQMKVAEWTGKGVTN